MNNSGYNKQIGALGEIAAQNHYICNGFVICARNFFNHRGKQFGEIDFVSTKASEIRFVEVKTRTSEKFGAPIEAITLSKLRKNTAIAQFFLYKNPQFMKCSVHFDCASVRICPVDKSVERITIYSDVIGS